MKKILYLFILFLSVSCVNTVGHFDVLDDILKPQPELPSMPNVHVYATADTVMLQWQKCARAMHYMICADADTLVRNYVDTAWVDSSASHIERSYTVISMGEHGSVASERVVGHLVLPPIVPADFTASNDQINKVLLSWKHSEGADAYNIYLEDTLVVTLDATDEEIQEFTHTNETSETPPPASLSTYKIEATNSVGVSPQASTQGKMIVKTQQTLMDDFTTQFTKIHSKSEKVNIVDLTGDKILNFSGGTSTNNFIHYKLKGDVTKVSLEYTHKTTSDGSGKVFTGIEFTIKILGSVDGGETFSVEVAREKLGKKQWFGTPLTMSSRNITEAEGITDIKIDVSTNKTDDESAGWLWLLRFYNVDIDYIGEQ